MTLKDAEEQAIQEAKTTGNKQVVYLIFEDGDLIFPNCSFCNSENFEQENINSDYVFYSLLPIGETTDDFHFEFLQLISTI